VTLQARVIAAVSMIAMVLVGVLVVVARTTESNMIDQVDEQLAAAVQPVRDVGFDDGPGGPLGPGGPPDPGFRDLSALYVGRIQGDEVVTLVVPGLNSQDVVPVVDVDSAITAAEGEHAFTAQSDGSDLRWRMRAYGTDGRVTVIGLPLDAVDDTVDQLIALEVVAAVVIFVALALVAFWVIRLGVRPIKKMTEVATAIGDGDLTHRVHETDPHTEAGQLGDALNKMLASIETNFAERRAVEERLRQFVADASHELRTPVATIRGYAELYRMGALDDTVQLDDAMRRTEQESIRMGALVDDMLSLARLDQGRPLDPTLVDLATLANDAVADARAVDPERTINAHTDGPVVVSAEESKIRQVLANLVVNAMVHTPSSAAIDVTVGTTDDGTGFIEVRDDGPGMRADVAAHAFERFYRADQSRSRHQGGSGLGLAIVDATVRAHGGSVTLDTAAGRGTAVRVELPST
jgi:two-component system OmpR family sensor kinase